MIIHYLIITLLTYTWLSLIWLRLSLEEIINNYGKRNFLNDEIRYYIEVGQQYVPVFETTGHDLKIHLFHTWYCDRPKKVWHKEDTQNNPFRRSMHINIINLFYIYLFFLSLDGDINLITTTTTTLCGR